MNFNDMEEIKSMTVGLDDIFKFHCDQCGKCCIHREDIILSPFPGLQAAGRTEI